jgi:3-deoxy-D-manno-octulosonic-acid transferase
MGEAISLIPVVKALSEILPDHKLIITTLSETGHQAVTERLNPEISTYLPVDYPFLINRFLHHYKPQLLLLMETEFWPNLISLATAHSIPIVVANGRVSPGTLKRYHIFSNLYKPLLQNIQAFIAQSEDDAKRAEEIGIPKDRITITNDIKYDQITDNPHHEKLKELEETLKVPGRRIIVAGSTHPGEHEPIIDEFARLLEKNPDTWMIIAPRHLEAVQSIKSKLKSSKIRYLERSLQLETNKTWEPNEKVLILDTMGDLAYIYHFASVCFVGGSLVPIGGHSPLEPAIFGKPVLTGPQAFNFSDANNILIKVGALEEVNNTEHLFEVIEYLLNNPEIAEKRGAAGMEAVKSVSGASKEIASLVAMIITEKRT